MEQDIQEIKPNHPTYEKIKFLKSKTTEFLHKSIHLDLSAKKNRNKTVF